MEFLVFLFLFFFLLLRIFFITCLWLYIIEPENASVSIRHNAQVYWLELSSNTVKSYLVFLLVEFVKGDFNTFSHRLNSTILIIHRNIKLSISRVSLVPSTEQKLMFCWKLIISSEELYFELFWANWVTPGKGLGFFGVTDVDLFFFSVANLLVNNRNIWAFVFDSHLR